MTDYPFDLIIRPNGSLVHQRCGEVIAQVETNTHYSIEVRGPFYSTDRIVQWNRYLVNGEEVHACPTHRVITVLWDPETGDWPTYDTSPEVVRRFVSPVDAEVRPPKSVRHCPAPFYGACPHDPSHAPDVWEQMSPEFWDAEREAQGEA